MNLEEYIQKNNKTHLIFDLDWTITKMIIDWDKWEIGAPKKLTKIDEKIIKDFTQRKINLSDLQNVYTSKYGNEVKDLIIKYNEKFEKEFTKGFEKNEELINLIKKLKNHKKYLWSSNAKGSVKRALKAVDLEGVFDKVVTRNDVKMIKPYLDGLKIILDPKVSKTKYLFIGDSGSDKKAAEKAGLDFFQITYFADNIERY